MKLSEATYFPDVKELTRHGFVSHMEDFIGKLIGDSPLSADVDDYLKGFDIDSKKALEMLTKPEIDGVPESAVVMRTERIKNGGTDEFGKPMKDEFQVIYRVPKKDMAKGIKGIDEKLRNLYIKLFENHIVEGTVLNEDGEGDGATNASSSGQYTTPLFGMVRRKGYSPKTTNEGKKKMKRPIGRLTMFITEAQMRELEKLLREEAVVDTAFGNFGFDAPVGDGKNNKGNDFYKEANSRDGMLTRKKNTAKWNKNLEEDSGIHIKKKNKGKFTATKKRTGKSTGELLHSPNKKTRARANFARMAKRGWKPLNESIYHYMEIDSSSLPQPLKKSAIVSKYKEEIEKIFNDYVSHDNINTSTLFVYGTRLKNGAPVRFSARRKVDKGSMMRAGAIDWKNNFGGKNYWLLKVTVLKIKDVFTNKITFEENFMEHNGTTNIKFSSKKEMLDYINDLIDVQNKNNE